MPTDEIVWEYYATWGPYGAERIVHGDESSRPTIRDLNASGSYPITGSANITAGRDRSVGFILQVQSTPAGTSFEELIGGLSTRLSHVLPWLCLVWMTSRDLFWAVYTVDAGITAAAGELYLMRQRLLDAVRRLFGR